MLKPILLSSVVVIVEDSRISEQKIQKLVRFFRAGLSHMPDFVAI